MNTLHKEWLRQLAADGQGGADARLPSITRGDSYRVTFAVPWDATAEAFVATLRLSPDAAGAALANFTVTIGPFADGYTEVAMELSEAAVDALPGDTDGNGLTELVYSVQRTPVGESESRFFAGNVFVSGKV